MPETYGTRSLSWYADQAPEYLDGEEDIEERDRRRKAEQKADRDEYLLERRERKWICFRALFAAKME